MATLGLVAGIGFITIAKSLSESFKAFGTKPIVLSIVTAALAIAALYLSSSLIDNAFTLFWVMSFIYLLFGIIHTAVSANKFIYTLPAEKPKVLFAEWLYTAAMMLIVTVVFAAVQYLFLDKYFLFYPLLFAALFFTIPYLVHLCFRLVMSIPYPVYTNWEYPLNHPLDPPEDNQSEKLLVIGFELPKTLASTSRTYFRGKTPESIHLGDMFYHFINDYNELQSETPIQIADERNEPLVWFMRLKPKWYQRSKVLNPNVTVRENGIKENSVIICEHFVNEPEKKTT